MLGVRVQIALYMFQMTNQQHKQQQINNEAKQSKAQRAKHKNTERKLKRNKNENYANNMPKQQKSV